MKGYKPYSKKFYTEDIVKTFSKYFIRHASYYGSLIYNQIEGRHHQNMASKYGGSATFSVFDDEYIVTMHVYRKNQRERKDQI